jgi:DNA polymerase elongation subunit (family B)
MQGKMLGVMAGAGSIAALKDKKEEIRTIFQETVRRLPAADLKSLVIHRRISRLTYAHRCLEGAAVQAYRDRGIEIAPGMKIGYIVRDARRYSVDTGWDDKGFDLPYYQTLLEKAWGEIAFAFCTPPLRGNSKEQELPAPREAPLGQ